MYEGLGLYERLSVMYVVIIRNIAVLVQEAVVLHLAAIHFMAKGEWSSSLLVED